MNRPLISFVVFCYNQEPFIREALQAAFAQTYSPLEIIVADDCSKDRSFEIIQDMAGAYRGPHALQVFRNPVNLGIAGNVNQAMEVCRGELVIAAAGDDVSLPMRTEVIYRAWEESGRHAPSVFSSYVSISKNGAEQGIGGTRGAPGDCRLYRPLDGDLSRFLTTREPMVNGCTAAWSPKLFTYFGPVRSDLEDVVLSFRTLASGQLLYIHQPLVKRRRHGDNVSFLAGEQVESFERREKRLRWVDEMTVKAYDNMFADVEILCENGRISLGERDRLKTEGNHIREHYRVERQLMDGSVLKRLRTLAASAPQGNLRSTLRLAPRLLPRPVYLALTDQDETQVHPPEQHRHPSHRCLIKSKILL